MYVALGFLFGLIAVVTIMPIADGAVLPLILPLLTAGGIIVVARKLPPVETERFGALVAPYVIGAAIPALYMLLQNTPLPSALSGLAHPVWASVAAGFTNPVAGSVSVDLGATALALLRYLTIVGAALLATAVTINRDRAEAVLIALTVAAAAVALGLLLTESFGAMAAREEALDIACLGLILSATCAILVLERHETRRAKLGLRDPRFAYAMLASIVAFLICATAIGGARSGSLIFAACCGLGLFCAVFLVRRLNLGRWGAGAIGVTASVIVIALMSGAAGSNSDPRLAFVKKDPTAVELNQRILADAPVLGVGAGAFSAIAPIYQFGEPGTQNGNAVTAAAKLSIEMGRAVLWAAVAASAAAVIALLRASAKRGRDSFYASAAASALVVLTVLAFVNVGLFGATLPIISAIIFGLGIAQSQGRGSA
jgi:hypothetical protein